jgi:hypothetical protein
MGRTRSQSAAAVTDIAWALHRLLQYDSPATLTPSAAASRTAVIRWLEQVGPLIQGVSPEARIQAPVFPLTSGQLSTLEAEIATYRPGRLKLSVHVRATLEHLHASLIAVQRSSFLLLAAVLGVISLNIVYLLLLTQTPRTLVISGNLLALTVILGIWALHHFGYLRHLWESYFHHAAVHP